MPRMRRELALAVLLSFSTAACSLKTYALKSVANTFSGTGNIYGRDDDPELVRAAIPFALKTMEQLADALPDHLGIRVALGRTCTSLAAGFFKEDAERRLEEDVKAAQPMFTRARHMALRGWRYAIEAAELSHKGSRHAIASGTAAEQTAALAQFQAGDVELLYWLGASWLAAISTGKDDMKLVGELPRATRVLERALALDESWDQGTLHELFILLDAGRGVDQGGGPKKAEGHYKRALELDHGNRLGPHVSYAESVLVDAQNKKEFLRLLQLVIDADLDVVDDRPYRLVNILAQRHAAWLLSRTDDLFAE